MGESLSKVQEEETRQLFNELDRNKDGSISVFELAEFLRMPISALSQTVSGYDKDGDERLGFEEFKELVEDRFLKHFNELDTDHDGKIGMDELRKYYTTHYRGLRKNDVDEICTSLDRDANGSISFKEFVSGLFKVLGCVKNEQA